MEKAHQQGYKVTLLYFWLKSPEQAIERVAERVSKGGHNIPKNIIVRRYYEGIDNLFKIYMPIVDTWVLVNNGAPGFFRGRPPQTMHDCIDQGY